MYLLLITTILSGILVMTLFYFLLSANRKIDENNSNERNRRSATARARLRAQNANPPIQRVNKVSESENENSEKIGAKKRAKLEAKAEKKAQKEAEEREREERKKKNELLEADKAKTEELEREEEIKREEDQRKAKEEEEKRDYEEYLKMKATFVVEESGFDQEELDESDLLQKFIQYIKDNKVVALEELAAEFKLRTQDVIDRIKDLQSNGTLTGVIDERGKFIFISQKELEGVAKFIKQRGRVSITELAENSQRLVNLTPCVLSET